MKTKAFTLLETILGIVIIIMILGSVYAFYGHSLEVVKAGRAHLAQSQLARVVLDRIAGELRSAPGLKSHFGPVLIGGPDCLELLTLVVPSRLVFFPKQLTDTDTNVEHDVRRVEYRLAVDEEDRPLGLKRSELRVLLAPIVEEDSDEQLMKDEFDEEDPLGSIERFVTEPDTDETESAPGRPAAQQRIVSDEIRYLEFQYYNGRTWSTVWNGEALPRAVRIIIGFKDVPDEQIQDQINLPFEDRPWADDQYSVIVSLAMSEELQARQVRAEDER